MAPDWEDPANTSGGRWMLNFDTEERKTKLDERWLQLLIMVLAGRAGVIVTGNSCSVTLWLDTGVQVRRSVSGGNWTGWSSGLAPLLTSSSSRRLVGN